jgi:Heterokaryon incompatibility protein (HET)
MLQSLFTKTTNPTCLRCENFNLPDMLEGKLPWTDPSGTLEISELRQSRHYRNLGPAGDVLFREDCPVCISLFACSPSPWDLSDEVHIVADWTIHRLERLVDPSSDSRHGYDKCLLVQIEPSDGQIALDEHEGDALGLLPETQSPGTVSLSPQLIDPKRLDITLVKRYLDSCKRFHKLTCTPKRSADLGDIVLIDTQTRALVRYPGFGCEYLTLSYTWGQIDQVDSYHYKVGDILPSLPRTIEDAMKLSCELGQRYIWVDSVCIDQTDEVHKRGQIQKMSNIYRDAYACIVSMCGSSMDSGIARVEGSSRVTHPQLSCSTHGRRLVGLMPTLSRQTHNTKWGSRSWTLQEALLSHRCIYVTDHQVYFECNAMQCSESLDESASWIHQTQRRLQDVNKEDDGATYGSGTLRNVLAGHGKPKSHMMVYGTLITLYSWRQMTKSSDALNAFSGILQHLKELAYEEGFFWGLPIGTFNWSLLWCPEPQYKRRHGFPAWSWAGWHGNVFPGWPADVTESKVLKTHFRAWKAVKGHRELIFTGNPTAPELNRNTPKLVELKTAFQSIEQQLPAVEFPRCDLLKAETEGYLFIDCAICKLDFVMGEPVEDWNYGPFYHHRAAVNGVECILRLPWDSPDYACDRSHSQANLALVGQELMGGMVYMHFLRLGIDGKGYATRKGVFVLIWPKNSPGALDAVVIKRRKLMLL